MFSNGGAGLSFVSDDVVSILLVGVLRVDLTVCAGLVCILRVFC